MSAKKKKSGQFDCCVCFETKRTQHGASDIFQEWTPKFLFHSTTMAAELSKLANVEIPESSDYPRLICKTCFHKLNSALQFVIDIRRSVDVLNKQLETLSQSPETKSDAMLVEISPCSGMPEEGNLDVKEEIFDDYEGIPSGEIMSENEDVDIKDEEGDITTQSLLDCKTSPDKPLPESPLDSDMEPDPLDGATSEKDQKSDNDMEASNHSTLIYENLRDKILKPKIDFFSNCTCPKKNCSKRIPKKQLKAIKAHFENLKSIADQKAFIKKFTKKIYRPNQSNKNTIIASFKYFLPRSLKKGDSKKASVCFETFKSVIPFDGNIDKIIGKNQGRSLTKVRSKGQKFRKNARVNEKVISVCDHFKELQKRKMKAIKLKKAGLLAGRIETFSYKKMYQLYSEWFNTTNYTKKLKSFAEYKNILISNIDKDHILTLQQSGSRKTSSEKVFKEDVEDDDDAMERESIHSNFSDELKQEIETNKTQVKEDPVISETKSGSDNETSDDDFVYDMDEIRHETVPKKSTRSSKLGEELQPTIQMEFGEDVTELLTEKTKVLTTHGATIRRYCRLRGLPYVTESGQIIPKKVLGPSCDCNRRLCKGNIPEEQRQYIFDYFYSLGHENKQAAFIVKFTERVFIIGKEKNRDFKLKYYLPLTKDFGISAPKSSVCRNLFFNTLACTSSHPISAWGRFKKDSTLSGNLSTEESELIAKRCTVRNAKCAPPEVKTNEIDFVYRAMPFDEYMSCFSSKKDIVPNSVNDEYPLGTSCESIKKKKTETVRKSKKLQGKQNINKQGKNYREKVLGPPCNCLKRGCTTKITQEQRQYLFDYYWNLGDIAKQRAFIIRFTEKVQIKRTCDPTSKRECNMLYYLPLTKDFDGEKLLVCSTMFSNTLVIVKHPIEIAWKKYAKGITFKDLRGSHYKTKFGLHTDDDIIASVKAHIDCLEKEHPELKDFKLNVRGVPVFKYQLMFRLYEKWFDPSKYPKRATSKHMYRTILKRLFYPNGDYQLGNK